MSHIRAQFARPDAPAYPEARGYVARVQDAWAFRHSLHGFCEFDRRRHTERIENVTMTALPK